jgi:integrase
MPLDKIQPRDIAESLRSIWLQKPETASRVKQRLHAVMAWGWANGYNLSNPVDVVSHLLPLQPSKSARTQHQPAMPWRDLPSFIAMHFGDIGLLGITERLLLFVILTAARSGEVRGMSWLEFDARKALWTIPGARMDRPAFRRHPGAIIHGNHRGVYGQQQAVHG